MRNFKATQQQGAVLVIALVMLLVLTVLAVSNMRGVILESKITANRAEMQRLQDAADAALREGEFRFYGPAHLRAKLEYEAENCKTSNVLAANGLNKPCLLKEMNLSTPDDTRDMRQMFYLDPLGFFAAYTDYANSYDVTTGAAVESGKVLAWMPYIGLDANSTREFQPDSNRESFWNTYLVSGSADESEALNVEYGAVLEGRGTYYYLVNGQAHDELVVQSTTANIYVGLNN